MWGVSIGEFVGVDELSECCVAFLWGEECKLEVLSKGLLCGVDIRFLGVPRVRRKCAVGFPWGHVSAEVCAEGLEVCVLGSVCRIGGGVVYAPVIQR